MKRISFIILGIALVSFFTLMSAGEEMSQEQKQQMDQVDQMVKEKVDAFKAEKDAECNTRVMAAADARADSTIKAMDAMKKGAPVKVVKKTTVKKVTKTEPTNSKNKWSKGKEEQKSKSKWETGTTETKTKTEETKPTESKSKWSKGKVEEKK